MSTVDSLSNNANLTPETSVDVSSEASVSFQIPLPKRSLARSPWSLTKPHLSLSVLMIPLTETGPSINRSILLAESSVLISVTV